MWMWVIIALLLIVVVLALGFWYFKHKTTTTNSTTSKLLMVSNNYAYGTALDASLYFYSCQKCGHVTGNTRALFRSDCHLNDPVVGGFHDAGDTIKVTQTIAFTVVMLAWGYLEWPAGYTGTNNTNLLDIVYWGSNYLMDCCLASGSVVGQVADPTVAHAIWDRPEDEKAVRASYVFDGKAPSSDLLGLMAAALAVTTLLPMSSTSKYTSAQLLSSAKTCYKLGAATEGKFSSLYTAVSSVYPSTRFLDKLALAAGWLYRATSDATYLTACRAYLARCDSYIGFNWDSCVWAAYGCLVGMAGGDSSSLTQLQSFTSQWMAGGGTTGITYTPKGLAVLGNYGVLRNAANAGFIALIYSKYSNTSPGTLFAQKQIDYMLGGAGRSLVVGFGSSPPTHTHHMSGSCPLAPTVCDWSTYALTTPNPQVITGALVGGSTTDAFDDVRSSYQTNEPSTEYNACFTGCLAALETMV